MHLRVVPAPEPVRLEGRPSSPCVLLGDPELRLQRSPWFPHGNFGRRFPHGNWRRSFPAGFCSLR
eukprot:13561421-Heterocapsa_arctica.AAC.1